jgi:acid phosphatase family membrane protein YuiD
MKYLLAPLVAWTIAQTAKVIIYSIREHRLNLRVLADRWMPQPQRSSWA